MKNVFSRLSFLFSLALLLPFGTDGTAIADFTEGFDVITDLVPPETDGLVVGDWFGSLRSDPIGVTGLFQGNDTVFESHSGATDSYIAMNFNNSGDGTINTFLISPLISMNDGDTVSFYTRGAEGIWADRMEFRMSTNGDSLDVGMGANEVGDFSNLLLSINPDLDEQYPSEWTQFTLTLSGLGGPTEGRLAFRYTVTDAGPSGVNSNYIGIDTFEYNSVPEPSSLIFVSMATLAFSNTRRRR